MYHVVAPPFIYPSAVGYYFIVNYQIIEGGILIIYALMPKDYMWGIERLLKKSFQRRKNKKFPNEVNHDILEMHTTPGGLCTGWKRKDFIIDGCYEWMIGVNPENADFRLQPDSPCKTAGQALSSLGIGFVDYYGKEWANQPSIGAIQYINPEEITEVNAVTNVWINSHPTEYIY